jgi:hypothetical protein
MNPAQKKRIENAQDSLVTRLERAVQVQRLAQQILARKRAQETQ